MIAALLIAFGVALALHVTRVMSSSRPPSQRAMVLAGNVVYGLALTALAFPPSSSSSVQKLVVLTAQATAADRREAMRASRALAIGDVELTARERRRIELVPGVAAARASVPGAAVWRVLGQGLSPAERVEDVQIEFSPRQAEAGFRDSQWPRTVRPGDQLTINGSVTARTLADVSVALLDPSGEQSASTRPDGQGQFTLSAATKAAGGVLFQLEMRTKDDVLIERVPVPVDIRRPEPVRILVRAAAPSFEIRYLKDWARRGGAAMVIDTTLSRDKQRREYINHEALSATRLGATLLSQFDLVILTARALAALDADEVSALRNAVRNTDLGGIVIGTGESSPTAALNLPASTPANDTVAAAVPGAGGTQVRVSARFTDSAGEPVVRALTGEALAKRIDVGQSAWVRTLIADSHRWITAGQPDAHALYWNTLIDAAVPPRSPVIVTTSPRQPYAQQQTLVCVRGSDSGRVELQADNADALALTMASVAARPEARCGVTYPAAGWHSVRVGGRGVARFYVLDTADWSVQQQWLAGEHTRQLAAVRQTPAAAASANNLWPRWPMAVLCLLLAAALWFEQRRWSV